MKITAISAEYSDKDAIALITEPQLTPEIFEEVLGIAQTPEFVALSLRLVSGCLLIQSPEFTPELRDSLDALLTQAEEIINPSANKTMTQEEADESEKQLALESAAAGFGLPIS